MSPGVVSVRLQVHQFGLICDNLDAVNKFEPNYRLIRRYISSSTMLFTTGPLLEDDRSFYD
uniref:Uncharacterized protein n=1 Tax=Zea mays TaxID=4577 RepID=B7ZZK6_MAIZE|nr:unknown [Zea mays]